MDTTPGKKPSGLQAAFGMSLIPSWEVMCTTPQQHGYCHPRGADPKHSQLSLPPPPDARHRTPDAGRLTPTPCYRTPLSQLPVEYASSQERQFHVIRTAPLDTKEIPHNYDVLRHCLKSTKEEVHEAEMRLHRQPVSNDEVRALALATSTLALPRPPRNRRRPPSPTHTHMRSHTRSPPPRHRWSGSARWRCSGRRRSST